MHIVIAVGILSTIFIINYLLGQVNVKAQSKHELENETKENAANFSSKLALPNR